MKYIKDMEKDVVRLCNDSESIMAYVPYDYLISRFDYALAEAALSKKPEKVKLKIEFDGAKYEIYTAMMILSHPHLAQRVFHRIFFKDHAEEDSIKKMVDAYAKENGLKLVIKSIPDIAVPEWFTVM